MAVFFPFKYKLTLLISSVIFILLCVLFFIVQKNIKEEFIKTIETDLHQSKNTVQNLMDIRKNNMFKLSRILQSNKLIRDILLDSSMDSLTANDLLNEEVLPNFPEIDGIWVISPDKKILGNSRIAGKLVQQFMHKNFVSKTLEGEEISGHIFYNNRCIQIVSTPLYVAEELIGIIALATVLKPQDIMQIHKMTGVEMAFFNNSKIFLKSNWDLITGSYDNVSKHINETLPKQLFNQSNKNQLLSMYINKEEFLYIPVSNTDNDFLPSYLVSKSLDKQLGFIETIRTESILISLLMFLLSLIVSFLFAKNISRPIQLLRDATTHVANNDYFYKVNISSHDEFAQLATSFNQMTEGLQEREKIRSAMQKVVSKKIADEMLKGDIILGGEEKQATVLFSDIRSFTQLSEGLSPTDLLSFLNKYFTLSSQCVDNNMGVIDKYIGDAIMALFGVPIAHKHSALNAVRTASDMLTALQGFNQQTGTSMGKKLSIGIGINSGRLIAGNMGAINRLNYTVLGDEVNLASRLEGLCKLYKVEIIISQSTYQQLQQTPQELSTFTFRKLDDVKVKGKSQAITIYQVITEPLEKNKKLLADFEMAREELLQQNFNQAEKQFTKLMEMYPSDGPSQVFYHRTIQYKQNQHLFTRDYQQGIYCCKEK
jgi:adenylate cyclase